MLGSTKEKSIIFKDRQTESNYLLHPPECVFGNAKNCDISNFFNNVDLKSKEKKTILFKLVAKNDGYSLVNIDCEMEIWVTAHENTVLNNKNCFQINNIIHEIT